MAHSSISDNVDDTMTQLSVDEDQLAAILTGVSVAKCRRWRRDEAGNEYVADSEDEEDADEGEDEQDKVEQEQGKVDDSARPPPRADGDQATAKDPNSLHARRARNNAAYREGIHVLIDQFLDDELEHNTMKGVSRETLQDFVLILIFTIDHAILDALLEGYLPF